MPTAFVAGDLFSEPDLEALAHGCKCAGAAGSEPYSTIQHPSGTPATGKRLSARMGESTRFSKDRT